MTAGEKVRENKARRLASDLGLDLYKSRARRLTAVDRGLYGLRDIEIGETITPALPNGSTCSWTLDKVEAYLRDVEPSRRIDPQRLRVGRWALNVPLAMGLPASECTVMVALSALAQGKVAPASLPKIAKAAGMTEARVERSLASLEKRGLITGNRPPPAAYTLNTGRRA